MRPIESPGRALLVRARNAVAAVFALPVLDEPDHPELWQPGATFVTLYTAGALRGCVGSLEALRSLGDDVRANAVAAAFRDPRFQPLSVAEFGATRFEVSLLAPAAALPASSETEAIAALVPHRDGVTLCWRDCRATLLPQVWSSLPDARDFLRTLKRKAGLPAHFWAPDVRLERYTVTLFAESAEVLA